jgi:tripartite-type tricarboxylate transporter receptor subunit TctC
LFARNFITKSFNEGHIMKLPRRQFLHLAAGAAALPTASRIARAQTYPTRPVHIVVGFPTGSTNDIFARLIGDCLSARLGQPFIIENRAGDGGNIGTAAVVNAAPDGYTLLQVASANAIAVTLYDKLNFNFIRDIAPIAGTNSNPFAMVVNPSFPAKTVPEFIAYAKANPGKVNMASSGIGTGTHLAGELFKTMTSVDMAHVPNHSGGQLNDLIGGQVQVVFSPLPSTIGQISSGVLRALAVTSKSRWGALPDVPTLGELVPGYEAIGWNGIGSPKDTPLEIIAKLNREINVCLTSPEIKARFVELSATAHEGTPADFGKFIADETEKWGKVIRTAGIKAE